MAKIISLQDSPLATLKQQLRRKDEQLVEKQKQIDDLLIRMGQVVSVNELLKLQIQDLVVNVNTLRGQCDQILSNLHILQTKLPNIIIKNGEEEDG